MKPNSKSPKPPEIKTILPTNNNTSKNALIFDNITSIHCNRCDNVIICDKCYFLDNRRYYKYSKNNHNTDNNEQLNNNTTTLREKKPATLPILTSSESNDIICKNIFQNKEPVIKTIIYNKYEHPITESCYIPNMESIDDGDNNGPEDVKKNPETTTSSINNLKYHKINEKNRKNSKLPPPRYLEPKSIFLQYNPIMYHTETLYLDEQPHDPYDTEKPTHYKPYDNSDYNGYYTKSNSKSDEYYDTEKRTTTLNTSISKYVSKCENKKKSTKTRHQTINIPKLFHDPEFTIYAFHISIITPLIIDGHAILEYILQLCSIIVENTDPIIYTNIISIIEKDSRDIEITGSAILPTLTRLSKNRILQEDIQIRLETYLESIQKQGKKKHIRNMKDKYVTNITNLYDLDDRYMTLIDGSFKLDGKSYPLTETASFIIFFDDIKFKIVSLSDLNMKKIKKKLKTNIKSDRNSDRISGKYSKLNGITPVLKCVENGSFTGEYFNLVPHVMVRRFKNDKFAEYYNIREGRKIYEEFIINQTQYYRFNKSINVINPTDKYFKSVGLSILDFSCSFWNDNLGWSKIS